jgi:hypothetical protein
MMLVPINHRSDIHWAPKVSLSKIRQLYLRESQGIYEEELIDEVGLSLYLRCESILEFTEAVQNGRVACKRCAGDGSQTIIQRQTRQPAELLKCPVCAWQVRWRVYVKEAKSTGNIHAGHAQQAFERYVQTYPRCQNVKEKIVAIDQLIHEFHWVILEDGTLPKAAKPAGVNLLQGSSTQVLAMLNELTYGKDAPPEMLEMRELWLARRSKQRNAIHSCGDTS